MFMFCCKSFHVGVFQHTKIRNFIEIVKVKV